MRAELPAAVEALLETVKARAELLAPRPTNPRTQVGPRPDAEPADRAPTLRWPDEAGRLSRRCRRPHCGGWIVVSPPRGSFQRGEAVCNLCSRLVAWLAPGTSNRAAGSGTTEDDGADPLLAERCGHAVGQRSRLGLCNRCYRAEERARRRGCPGDTP